MIYDEGAAQGSTENREAGRPTVLVGYDGSKPAEAALRWAVQEASRRQAVLRVLTAYDPYPLSGWSVVDLDEWRVTATEQAADAAELVAELSGGTVEAEARAVRGPPAKVLLGSARHAALLVMGSEGHLGMLGALAGSISRRCARLALCPVVIVGPEAQSERVTRIVTSAVLDIDGDVTGWLAAELQHRPVPVFVVDSWNLATVTPPAIYGEVPAELRRDAEIHHEEAVTRLRKALPPGSEVVAIFRAGQPVDGFTMASRPGDLVVIPRTALHDVAVAHETCPVMVVPPPPEDGPDPDDRTDAVLGVL
jgi:nucleotide-binding universal stress UspA family protein